MVPPCGGNELIACQESKLNICGVSVCAAANENNHNHMVVSSLFETVIFIAVSVFQLFYVQKWFEGKEVTGRKTSKQWA